MTTAVTESVRLTSLAHGGGCGCKLAPAVLEQIIARSAGIVTTQLLVGLETSDDAAVYRISETQALVATTDFFMPIVDDPYDFGAIAATNAISDVYAMGGTPALALALVGMPIDKLAPEVIKRILKGGEQTCQRAGIPIAGGHSIDTVEPIYGLVAIGLVDPRHLKRNTGARPGDVLVLGKPLGVGVYSSAFKKEQLDDTHYRAMLAVTTHLNTPGAALGRLEAVHALTDVTGFGLLGHLLEISKGSKVRAVPRRDAVPRLPDVMEMIAEGHVTGGSHRNWQSYGRLVDLGSSSDAEKWLLTDPQTSGGLLASCHRDAVNDVLAIFRKEGFAQAAVVGEIAAGAPGVSVV